MEAGLLSHLANSSKKQVKDFLRKHDIPSILLSLGMGYLLHMKNHLAMRESQQKESLALLQLVVP
jgi:hypothetical protein